MKKINLHIFLLILLIISTVHANIITQITGLDSLVGSAGDELRQSINQAESALLVIQNRFNEDIKDRIAQIEEVVQRAIKDINALETKTLKDVNDIILNTTSKVKLLELTFINHLRWLIQESECAAKRYTLQDLNFALGGFGRIIGTHKIRVTAPLLYPEEKNQSCWLSNCMPYEKEFTIKEPFNITYNEIKKFMLERVDKARTDTPIDTLLTTYEYIADLALRASCLAPSSADRLRADYVKYYMKAYQFKYLFNPAIGTD